MLVGVKSFLIKPNHRPCKAGATEKVQLLSRGVLCLEPPFPEPVLLDHPAPSTWLRKMKNKTIVRHYLTCVMMAIIKKRKKGKEREW